MKMKMVLVVAACAVRVALANGETTEAGMFASGDGGVQASVQATEVKAVRASEDMAKARKVRKVRRTKSMSGSKAEDGQKVSKKRRSRKCTTCTATSGVSPDMASMQ